MNGGARGGCGDVPPRAVLRILLLTEKRLAFTISMDNFEEPGGISACLSDIDAVLGVFSYRTWSDIYMTLKYCVHFWMGGFSVIAVCRLAHRVLFCYF